MCYFFLNIILFRNWCIPHTAVQFSNSDSSFSHPESYFVIHFSIHVIFHYSSRRRQKVFSRLINNSLDASQNIVKLIKFAKWRCCVAHKKSYSDEFFNCPYQLEKLHLLWMWLLCYLHYRALYAMKKCDLLLGK